MMILVHPQRCSLSLSGCATNQEAMVRGLCVRARPSRAPASFNRDHMQMNLSALCVLSRPCFGQNSPWRGNAIWFRVNTIPRQSCPRMTLWSRPLYQLPGHRKTVPSRSITLWSIANVIPPLACVAALLPQPGLRCTTACWTIKRMSSSFREYTLQSFPCAESF